MSEHRATVEWQRSGEFRYESYSRAHTVYFGQVAVPGNAAAANIPATVPPQEGVDPEQAFVAALSSCHMLGHAPDAAELNALHHAAHAKCFIAKSVKSEVRVEPC